MSARELITCRELIGFIADYMDGQLSRPALDDFHRHIAHCVSCRAYLQSYEWTVRLGKVSVLENSATVEEAPEELVQAILRVKQL